MTPAGSLGGGGHDRNAVPRPSRVVRGRQKPRFNQVFLVPVQGPPRRAAHPRDTPLPALLFVVTLDMPNCRLRSPLPPVYRCEAGRDKPPPRAWAKSTPCGPCFQAARGTPVF